MLLTELVLHNVSAYKGRQVVNLRTDPGKPIILVGGLNGCGKTTFLDAIQLALYGNRARLSNRGSMAYEDFLKASISRGVDPTEGGSVSLTFDVDDDGLRHTYKVVRGWVSTGKRFKETLEVFVDDRWDEILSGNWADHVEDLLPLEIAGLFFFDGEKIEALADPERAATVIQTAVHSLLGISTLEQLRTDLTVLQRRQLPQSGDPALDQKLIDLQDQFSKTQASIDQTAQRFAAAQAEIRSALNAEQKAEREFARDGGDLFERRTELETERRMLSSQLSVVETQLRSQAEGLLPLLLVEPILLGLSESAKERPSAVSIQFALEALKNHDESVLHLFSGTEVELLKKALAAATTAAANNFSSNPVGDSSAPSLDLGSTLARLGGVRSDVEALLASSGDLKSALDAVDVQLAGVPDSDAIQQLQDSLHAARLTHAEFQGRARVLGEDLEQLKRERANLETQIAKTEADRLHTEIANEDVRRILEHTLHVQETLTELRERLLLRHIAKIEIATLESFGRLMRKSGLVADLRIDPQTFAMTLITGSGDEIDPSRLSAGERQLLAVALLWGLARVAGNRLPTVIDTPLGRLDSVHRQHLVDRYFPLAGDQVILLSTDEEIDEKLVGRLSPSISHSYTLEHDEAELRTEVASGYFWPIGVSNVA